MLAPSYMAAGDAGQCAAGRAPPGREEEGGEEEEIEDLLYALLTRKEVSVGWKDTSIPHLLGYGSILYVVEQLLMYPSDLLKTRLQVDLRPDVNLSKVRAAMRTSLWATSDCVRGYAGHARWGRARARERTRARAKS